MTDIRSYVDTVLSVWRNSKLTAEESPALALYSQAELVENESFVANVVALTVLFPKSR